MGIEPSWTITSKSVRKCLATPRPLLPHGAAPGADLDQLAPNGGRSQAGIEGVGSADGWGKRDHERKDIDKCTKMYKVL